MAATTAEIMAGGARQFIVPVATMAAAERRLTVQRLARVTVVEAEAVVATFVEAEAAAIAEDQPPTAVRVVAAIPRVAVPGTSDPAGHHLT